MIKGRGYLRPSLSNSSLVTKSRRSALVYASSRTNLFTVHSSQPKFSSHDTNSELALFLITTSPLSSLSLYQQQQQLVPAIRRRRIGVGKNFRQTIHFHFLFPQRRRQQLLIGFLSRHQFRQQSIYTFPFPFEFKFWWGKSLFLLLIFIGDVFEFLSHVDIDRGEHLIPSQSRDGCVPGSSGFHRGEVGCPRARVCLRCWIVRRQIRAQVLRGKTTT